MTEKNIIWDKVRDHGASPPCIIFIVPLLKARLSRTG